MNSMTNLAYKIIALTSVLFFFHYSAIAAQSIGLITAGGGQGFFGDIEKGAKQASKELGITIHVRGLANESNNTWQHILIDYMIKKECSGLIIAPTSKECKKDVAELKAKGIPTVYIDREIGGERVSVVSTNNSKAGELAGKEMVKALNGKGTVAVLRYKKGVQTTNDREEEFIKEAKKGGLNIVIDSYLGTTVGEARESVTKIFKNGMHVDGIFTPNESTTKGTIYSLKALNKAGKATHIGFDSSDIIINALKSNQLYGFVVQRPFKMGYVAVYTVYDAMQHKEIKDKIYTGAVFVSNKNIDDAEVKKLLGNIRE